MREIHPAALKHGIEAADIKHAVRHALRVIEREEGSRVYVGPARNGELLEVITSRRPDGFEIAIHVMKMRPKYVTLLPRECQWSPRTTAETSKANSSLRS